MSADNGIYVLQCREPKALDGYLYYVRECCGFDHLCTELGWDLSALYHTFANAKVFTSKANALEYAEKLLQDACLLGGVEYGIQVVDLQGRFPTKQDVIKNTASHVSLALATLLDGPTNQPIMRADLQEVVYQMQRVLTLLSDIVGTP